jgi:N-acyl homoserine lactone hydrolase
MTAASLRRERLVRVDLLDLGHFDVGPGKRRILIPGFLLTTDTGRRILFDTGFPPAYASDERAQAKADGLDRFGRLIGYGLTQTIPGALALHGLSPADITHVILSHGHIDHVGGLPLFAHAEIILTATERAAPRPLYFGTARPIAWPEARYRLITRATEVCTGLRLIPTPGHTPGHLSALVKLPGTSLLLAVDAINRASEPAEGFPDAMDPVPAATSAAQLLRLAHRHGAQMIYGHDPDQGLTLPGASWT